MVDVRTVTPILSVRDVDESLGYYVDKPTNFEWGMREMNVRDPDGHRIRFGTPTDAPADGVPFAPE